MARLRTLVDVVSKVKIDQEQKYKDYHNFRRPLSNLHSYQYLAMARGEKEKAVKLSFVLRASKSNVTTNGKGDFEDNGDWLLDRALLTKGFNGIMVSLMPKTSEKQDALKKARARLRKMCERMWRRQLKEMAEEGAIMAFSQNLHQKMLTPPLHFWINKSEQRQSSASIDEGRVVALDPGFAHGTKVAVINTADCQVLGTYTLNMRKPMQAVHSLRSILWDKKEMSPFDVVAIGNGHGSQAAVKVLREAICDNEKLLKNIIFVDESGASVYSGKQYS